MTVSSRRTLLSITLACSCALTSCGLGPVLHDWDRSWNLWLWDFDADKEQVRSVVIADIEVVVLANGADTERVDLALDVFTELVRSVPIEPASDVERVILVFGDEDDGGALAEVNRAITPARRAWGTRYVFFFPDADVHSIEHELVHAVWQNEASTLMPLFVSEGAVYAVANPEPGFWAYPVEPAVLLRLPGVFPVSGDFTQGEVATAAEFLQYDVMQAFWDQVAAIDPALPYRALQVQPSPEHYPAMADVHGFLLDLATPASVGELRRFLDGCSVLSPPSEANLWVLPGIEEGLPKVMVYFLDAEHRKREEEVMLWYQSRFSQVSEEPRRVRSNNPLVFTKYPLVDAYWICVTTEHPLGGERQTVAFEYREADSIWHPVDIERCDVPD